MLELHGNIHSVVCLDCGARVPRAFVQAQLLEANPGLAGALATPLPDGDAHLEPGALEDFQLPACTHCGGTLMPDVIFFGDNLPPARTACAMPSRKGLRAWFCRMDARHAADSRRIVGNGLDRAQATLALHAALNQSSKLNVREA